MKHMSFEEIAVYVRGTLHDAGKFPKDFNVTGVVTDNRKIQQGNLFIPLKGNKVDAHDFIKDAFEKGASLVLSERPLTEEEALLGAYIQVESTYQALKDLAACYRRTLNIPVVGIVGSVGKTSTKEMVSAVLSQKYNVLKTQGNFNNEIGLPITLLSIQEEHAAAVVEMGISDFGEMDRLGTMALPTHVVMTNIGPCHLENLHDLDGVLKAKSEIFSHMAPGAQAFLNGDDEKLFYVRKLPEVQVYHYGLGTPFKDRKNPERKDCPGEGLDFYATKVTESGLENTRAAFGASASGAVAHQIPETEVLVPVPGMHQVSNALAAWAVGLSLGLTPEEIVKGIASVEVISGRNRFISLRDGITVIDDCYNANPVSMKASLGVLAQAKGRKIAVLGDMGELGPDERKLHEEVGQAVLDNGIDVLYTAGALSREIAGKVILSHGPVQVHPFDTRDAMIPELVKEIGPGDTVLVKASHFMEFDKVVSALCENFSCDSAVNMG